jgi:hypothetical protein
MRMIEGQEATTGHILACYKWSNRENMNSEKVE